MSNSCSTTTTAIHALPKTLKVHHQLNPRNTIPTLRKKSVRTRCHTAKSGYQAEPKDYYQILGIAVNSTAQEIKEAYRSLQKKHHPDIAGEKGHEYSLRLNVAYHALMREDPRRRYDDSNGKGREGFASRFSGVGHSSWNGSLRPQALFVDENKCIGCRECVHHASDTFIMDDAVGCARVKVQYGDDEKKIEVSVDSCPVNCIHWVDSEDLPVLEFLIRPQPKQGHGVFGGGWEKPADVFAAAKYFMKQLNREKEQNHHSHSGQANVDDETPAQAKARHEASLKLQIEKLWPSWTWLKDILP